MDSNGAGEEDKLQKRMNEIDEGERAKRELVKSFMPLVRKFFGNNKHFPMD